MRVTGLPGVKAETETWMRNLLLALQEAPIDFEISRYRHWSENHDPDARYEASMVAERSVDLVIAKSLGTFIATLAFDSFRFKPRQAIFIGTPLGRHSEGDYELLLRFLDQVPTLFIQQTSDFNGSYIELANVVGNHQNATLVEVSGDDHLYADIDELQKIILPLLSGNT